MVPVTVPALLVTTGATVPGWALSSEAPTAAKVLTEAGEAMSCGAITQLAMSKGYWSPKGKTPHATLYSAILWEIQKKGDDGRFVKVERGRFALNK